MRCTLRLIDITRVRWQNRTHSFAMAARTMRQILTDSTHASRNQQQRGAVPRVPLDDALVAAPERQQAIVALGETVARRQPVRPRPAEVIELRCLSGLTLKETASALDVSIDAMKRHSRFGSGGRCASWTGTPSHDAGPTL